MTVGWKTLDVGEKALVYNKDGRARIEEGPQRIFLFREKFIMMRCFSASQKRYLRIEFRNGKIEHKRGPCVHFHNDLIHTSIMVKDLVSLDANEALVVYRQDNETKKVTRRIQFGPTLFMPGENEWLHNFSWHGTDPDNKTKMVKGANKFVRLQVIPDQFYYNVDEVRTADDALIRIKMMLFYELKDIKKMLDATCDPMADIINCLCADVIAFSAKKTYEEFIETASALNNLENYPQLMERTEAIGYNVSKIVFRGYFAHEKLQNMHNLMIRKRTDLKIKYEEAAQVESLKDFKLEADINRMEQEQEMEMKTLIHEQEMAKDALKHQVNLEKERRLQSMEKKKQEDMSKLGAKRATDKLTLQHLTDLHDIDVDVTSLMEGRTGKPAKLTRIVTSSKAANVHFHHNEPVSFAHGKS